MSKTTFFVVLMISPLMLTIVAPTFRGSFGNVAPATIYGLASVCRYKGKDDGKRHG